MAMRSHLQATILSTTLLLGMVLASSTQAQVVGRPLHFNSVQACRIVDTRSASAGKLLKSAPRAFDVVGETTDYSAQGGVAGGCGIPGFAAGQPRVQAVAINVEAVGPTGGRFLSVWPSDQTSQSIPTVNFQNGSTNLDIASGVIVPVRQDVQGGDITIVAGVSNAHVIVDVTGYFSQPQPRQYYLTNASTFNGSLALLACTSGYHMASLWEIFDTSDLAYNSALGFTQADTGAGAPSQGGWIRTGASSDVGNFPGTANCNTWTTSVAASNGTFAAPSSGWMDAGTTISPWASTPLSCSANARVWCVEN